MDPRLSSTEDVSLLSPTHDNDTKISSSDVIKSNGKAPKSSSDNELEAGLELREAHDYLRSRPGFKPKSKLLLNPYSARGAFKLSLSASEEDEYITVKDKAGEDEEKMNIHEAICLKCSEGLKYADNVLKMKCKCKTFALIHDCCPSDKDCSNCKHPIEYVPVTLLPSEDSHQTSSDGQVIIRRSRLRMLFNKLACGRACC